ncbi:MAG: DUF86 domain-containing protein [Phycisphaerae bacterium]|nr:DUF86 domain-containing protein [Phycisphaerae bacterium]
MTHDEPSRDIAALIDIDVACRRVSEFVTGLSREAFVKDVKTHSAVLYEILVIGEAVRRISADFQLRNPDVPWRSIVGMRNRVVHQYDSVDLSLI